MGLLINIGKRGATGYGAIIFWFVTGGVLGASLTQIVPNSAIESAGWVLALIGAFIGMAIGFYAA
jgi:hypothetical protein